MKRSELTVREMENRGWCPTNPNELRLKDIVYNIQTCWTYLRCTTEEGSVYESTRYDMCATYRVYSHKEYLEVSMDNKTWYKVAFRYVPFNERCIYADQEREVMKYGHHIPH